MSGSKKSSSSFQQLLHQVAKEKLDELNHQKKILTEYYTPVLAIKEETEGAFRKPFLVQKFRALHSAIKNAPLLVCNDENLKYTIECNEVFFERAETDPTVNVQLLEHWIGVLEKQIKFILNKCDYSFLYGSILTEWLEEGGKAPAPQSGTSSLSASYENITGLTDERCNVDTKQNLTAAEKEKMIQELSERIFHKHEFDSEAFKSLLDGLFFSSTYTTELQKMMSEEIIKGNDKFGKYLQHKAVIDIQDVKYCIGGLISEDCLQRDKISALGELRSNTDALTEIASLLTNRLRNVHRWNWPDVVLVEVRRGIKGRYRAFMDEDIITALFLQYVGMKWTIHLKKKLHNIYYSGMWNRSGTTSGIELIRQQKIDGAFLTSLPSNMKSQANTYNSDDKEDENADSVVQASLNIKYEMQHTISNEIHLNREIRPEMPMTVVQTDLEWFGPSLNHDAIMYTFATLGVSQIWIDFFRRFLETPIIFDPKSKSKVRQRGTPISHALSMLFGELMLYIMDFHVKKETGINLNRVHDDIIFWGHNSEKVIKAWEVMNNYAKIVGLKFNEEKSGSLKATGEIATVYGDVPLPQKSIHSGFLLLHSDGIFRVDDEEIKPFVKEMSALLRDSKKVMEWINIYNRYMAFFQRNFGKSAKVFGRSHIEEIIKALESIHLTVFKDTNGDVVEAIKRKFPVFNGMDIIDAWAYWPVQIGGLGLNTPMLEMNVRADQFKNSEDSKLYSNCVTQDLEIWKSIEAAKVMLMEKGEKAYKKKKLDDEECWNEHENPYEYCDQLTEVGSECFSCDNDNTENVDFQKYNVEKIVDNMKILTKQRRIRFDIRPASFETFCKLRETKLTHWETRFKELLECPPLDSPKCPPDMSYGLETYVYSKIEQHSSKDEWLFCRYGPQIVELFGNYEFINTDLIPRSMIASIRSAKLNH